MKVSSVPFSGTKEQEAKLLEVIAKYKDMKGALMPIMQEAQDIYGYLPYQVQKIISDETKRLARLVRSMLDLSRIDSGAMTLKKQNFNLSEVIFRALLSFEHRIEEKHIDIQGFDDLESVTVNGDPDLIHQVLYNLFDNAVKFTNEGGYIRVGVTVQNKVATVSIANSGIGVSTEELSHIFERFYKTDKSRSFDRQGVGLGLYIVKTIVTLHGGRIHAEGAEGNYCNIIFTLPEASDGTRPSAKNRKKGAPDDHVM